MNDLHARRLLNVARALRESPAPEMFTMAKYGHPCGTPACAFGHYCARGDLQDEFTLAGFNNSWPHAGRVPLMYNDDVVLAHFGITREEAHELFHDDVSDEDGLVGCGNAQTALEAADYIERFVAARAGKAGERA